MVRSFSGDPSRIRAADRLSARAQWMSREGAVGPQEPGKVDRAPVGAPDRMGVQGIERQPRQPLGAEIPGPDVAAGPTRLDADDQAAAIGREARMAPRGGRSRQRAGLPRAVHQDQPRRAPLPRPPVRPKTPLPGPLRPPPPTWAMAPVGSTAAIELKNVVATPSRMRLGSPVTRRRRGSNGTVKRLPAWST